MKENVTIVIPVYNRAHLIERTLRSAYAQTHRPLRVILVDNNSTDSTIAACERWAAESGLKKRGAVMRDSGGFELEIHRESRQGAAIARNSGLRRVDTEWTLFFDSDDEMAPRLVEKALAASSGHDVVYWRAHRVQLDGRIYPMPFSLRHPLRCHLAQSLLSTQMYMIRTGVIKALGGWDERTRVWDDWELGWRILLCAPKMIGIDEDLVTIHAQADSLTGTDYKSRQGEWEKVITIMREETRRRAGRHLLPSELKIEEVEEWLDFRQAILAGQYWREGDKAGASELLTRTLGESRIGKVKQLVIKALYRYTAHGGRGAHHIFARL